LAFLDQVHEFGGRINGHHCVDGIPASWEIRALVVLNLTAAPPK
jgi:hypothetical protein